MRKLRKFGLAVLCAVMGAVTCVGQVAAEKSKLRVFFIDVEGGQATLFITPSGTSLLVDTGWEGHDGRDADRIAAVAKREGLQKIDYVLLTHYHEDHAGGVPQLVARIPVGEFIDHGPNRELDHGIVQKDYDDYQAVLASSGAKHLTARAGEKLSIAGLGVRVISADGKVIGAPLVGAGQANPYCAATETRPVDETENARSLGIEVTFAGVKILDLGDLTWNKEKDLMCPVNRLGRVDVLIVSHHGWNQSSSPALIDAIGARVAVMDNGAMKGGSPEPLKLIRAAPGLEDLWQLHYANDSGAGNVEEKLIANPQGSDGAETDKAFGLELEVSPSGAYEVVNERTGYRKSYGK